MVCSIPCFSPLRVHIAESAANEDSDGSPGLGHLLSSRIYVDQVLFTRQTLLLASPALLCLHGFGQRSTEATETRLEREVPHVTVCASDTPL